MRFLFGFLLLAISATIAAKGSMLILKTQDEHLVGFILSSQNFENESGDCVFTLLAEKVELVNTPLAKIVSKGKASGEHSWENHNGSIIVKDGKRIVLSIASSGEISNNEGMAIGYAFESNDVP